MLATVGCAKHTDSAAPPSGAAVRVSATEAASVGAPAAEAAASPVSAVAPRAGTLPSPGAPPSAAGSSAAFVATVAPRTAATTAPNGNTTATARATVATPVAPVTQAEPGKPAILTVSVSPAIVHNGETVSWDVKTTPDVTAVEAKVSFATLSLQKQAPGHFVLAFTIPTSAPPFMHSAYKVNVVAHAGYGETLTRTVSLEFR
jgi:hypothetical protein